MFTFCKQYLGPIYLFRTNQTNHKNLHSPNEKQKPFKKENRVVLKWNLQKKKYGQWNEDTDRSRIWAE